MSLTLRDRRGLRAATHGTDCACMGCKMAAGAADQAQDIARANDALLADRLRQIQDHNTRRLLGAQHTAAANVLARAEAGIDLEDALRGQPADDQGAWALTALVRGLMAAVAVLAALLVIAVLLAGGRVPPEWFQ